MLAIAAENHGLNPPDGGRPLGGLGLRSAFWWHLERFKIAEDFVENLRGLAGGGFVGEWTQVEPAPLLFAVAGDTELREQGLHLASEVRRGGGNTGSARAQQVCQQDGKENSPSELRKPKPLRRRLR